MAALMSGCVHVYQPLTGLHRPLVVDITAPNFADLSLSVRCVKAKYMTRQDVSQFCGKVATLFENQGAKVHQIDDGGPAYDDFEDEPEEEEVPRTDLSLVLTSRRLHQADYPMLWMLSIASATLIPAVTETTFALDVTVRDGEGFLLVKDGLEGRMIRRFGAGAKLGNFVANVGRKKEDRVKGRTADKELSADLYGQLSQIVFNAKMNWEVLQLSAPPVADTGVSE